MCVCVCVIEYDQVQGNPLHQQSLEIKKERKRVVIKINFIMGNYAVVYITRQARTSTRLRAAIDVVE